MKSYSEKKSFTTIKRRVLTYLLIIIIGIISIFLISLYSGESLKQDSRLIKVLGKQRMLTQSISKNASRLSVINSALQAGDSIQTADTLMEKQLLIAESLRSDASQYQSVYEDLFSGEITINGDVISIDSGLLNSLSPEMQSVAVDWEVFRTSIQTLTESEAGSTEFRNALIYINEHNESLLKHSESILDVFENAMIKRYEFNRNIVLLLIGLIVAIGSVLMYQMYADLFKALNVFYRHIDKLGLDHDHAHGTSAGKYIADEVESMFVGFTETLELTEKINTFDSFTDSLNYIYKSFSHFLPYSYIGIALLSDSAPFSVTASYGISENRHNGLAESLIGYNIALSETSLEQIMISKEPRIINDLEAYFNNKKIKSYSQIVMDHGIQASITMPLEANGKPIGFIFFSSDRKNVYQKRHIEYLKILSNTIALSFQKNIFVDDLVYSSVLALAKLSEARDEDTGDHLVRMSRYVEVIANQLKSNDLYKDILTREYITDLVKFSPMHDIGKVGIPDGILLKPGKLTYEEFEIMKTHTQYGANVLVEAENNIKRRGRSLFSMGIEIAMNHHEKYDGTGYPQGIKGDQIPLCARIVTVADVFDALLSKRPYKEPFPLDKTLAIIEEGRGKHFDPDIVDALFDALDELQSIKVEYM